jgi:hypothetical protein
MAVQLKAWDDYVSEAQREPVLLPIGDGEVLTIDPPTWGQLKKVNEATARGDIFGQLTAMVGEQNALKLEYLFDDAPYEAISALLRDVTREFGLLPTSGETSASPS